MSSQLLLAYDSYQQQDAVAEKLCLVHAEFSASIGVKSELEVNLYLQNEVSLNNIKSKINAVLEDFVGRRCNEAATRRDHGCFVVRHFDLCAGRFSSSIAGNLKSILVLIDLKLFQYACLCSRDNFDRVITQLLYFAGPMFNVVHAGVRAQVLWLLQHLIEKGGVLRSAEVVLTLLRNVRGGESIGDWLAEALIDLLLSHMEWTVQHHGAISTSVFVYLRLILDHQDMPNLKTKEVQYCSHLLRDHFSECCFVGRDLIRALWEASLVDPLIGAIYRSIMSGGHGKSAVEKVLYSPTPKHFLQSRLTVEMETCLIFIMEKVQWGLNDDVYFQWFTEMFLSQSKVSNSVMADTIRFVVCCFHPSNSLLQSPVIPRYAIIGKFLKAITGRTVSNGMKMAIFFDWVTFESTRDSIMNIEPGLLLMDRSVDKYTYITRWCLEFLSYLTTDFNQSLSSYFRQNLVSAVKTAIDKGVLRNMDHMLLSAKFDDSYQLLMKTLITGEVIEPAIFSPLESPSIVEMVEEQSVPEPVDTVTHSETKQTPEMTLESLWMYGSGLEDLQLALEKDSSNETINSCVQALVEVAEKFPATLLSLSFRLQSILEQNQENDEPIFSLFRLIGGKFAGSITGILKFLNTVEHLRVSARFLRFLTQAFTCEHSDARYFLFLDQCNLPVQETLDRDMATFVEEDFFKVLELFYRTSVSRNVNLWTHLRRAVSELDPRQMYSLAWNVLCGNFKMLDHQQWTEHLNETLSWDGFEQQNFWQLYYAHISVYQEVWLDFVQNSRRIFLNINSTNHPEASWGLLTILRLREPNELTGAVLANAQSVDDSEHHSLSKFILQHINKY